MKIKVSVIMPMLNVAPYIKRSLSSVQLQSLEELEIICVDAGSTDGTLEILEECASKDKRIHIIHSEQKSYGHQLNLGIDLAKGEYIGIVEADDYIEKDMYQALYQKALIFNPDYIRANVYRQLTFKGTERKSLLVRSMPDHYYNRLIRLKQEPEAMLYANYFNIWDGIYQTSFLREKNIRLHESPGASYQDAGFAILCSIEAENIMFADTAYYCYRLDNEGSSVKSQEKYQCTLDEFLWIREQMSLRGKTGGAYQALYRCFFWDACNWNLTRLTQHYRKHFLSKLPEELMEDFDESILKHHIIYRDTILKGCKGDTDFIHHMDYRKAKVKKGMNTLKMLLEINAMLIFVTVQPSWKNVIDTMLLLDPDVSWSICDNSEHKQGTDFYGKAILSVPEAAHQYPHAYFILPDAKYTNALTDQLITLDIPSAQMDQTLCRLEDIYFNIDILTNRIHVDEEELIL